jgi:hypothetical protein
MSALPLIATLKANIRRGANSPSLLMLRLSVGHRRFELGESRLQVTAPVILDRDRLQRGTIAGPEIGADPIPLAEYGSGTATILPLGQAACGVRSLVM